MSDKYVHNCCKYADIKSKSKRYKYRKAGEPYKTYENVVLRNLNINGPLEVVVSDMTAFWLNQTYYKLTLYLDLFNNKIIGHALSNKRGDPNTYHDGLNQVLDKKKEQINLK